MTDKRIEKDALGEVRVPAHRMWGAQTQRSIDNFPIGVARFRFGRPVIRALGRVKQAAALANAELDQLPRERAELIARAAQEVVDGETEVLGIRISDRDDRDAGPRRALRLEPQDPVGDVEAPAQRDGAHEVGGEPADAHRDERRHRVEVLAEEREHGAAVGRAGVPPALGEAGADVAVGVPDEEGEAFHAASVAGATPAAEPATGGGRRR